MNTAAPARMGLIGTDVPLTQLLDEAARSQSRYAFEVEAIAADIALDRFDVLLYFAASGESLSAAVQSAQDNGEANPMQVRLLVFDAGLPEPDDDCATLFHGIFKKPFRLLELLDRAATSQRLLHLKTLRALGGQVTFDPFNQKLEDKKRGVTQTLTARESMFLMAVVEAGEKGLSRAQAATDVWGFHADVDSHAVETTAYRLRQKLQTLFGESLPLHSRDGAYVWEVE